MRGRRYSLKDGFRHTCGGEGYTSVTSAGGRVTLLSHLACGDAAGGLRFCHAWGVAILRKALNKAIGYRRVGRRRVVQGGSAGTE